MSEDRRQEERVSTCLVDVTATLDAESGCPVVDVSPTGFAALSRSLRFLGTTVPVALQWGGREFSGAAWIQSVHRVDPGEIRYGLRPVEGPDAGDDLQNVLAEIHHAVSAQRR